MGFLMLFKFYKWYQIVQSITYVIYPFFHALNLSESFLPHISFQFRFLFFFNLLRRMLLTTVRAAKLDYFYQILTSVKIRKTQN